VIKRRLLILTTLFGVIGGMTSCYYSGDIRLKRPNEFESAYYVDAKNGMFGWNKMKERFPGWGRPDFCFYIPWVDNSSFDYQNTSGDDINCYQFINKKGSALVFIDQNCEFFPRLFVEQRNKGTIAGCSTRTTSETVLTVEEAEFLKRHFGDKTPTRDERYMTNLSSNLWSIGLFMSLWLAPSAAVMWILTSLLKNDWRF